ncbi:helix-turn-helix domain-containing protein [Cohnella lubricantis]|uniref:Helix-turn-helix transcriptional regulator n=1 Tax=Cohnella lubricantis TaxID=2163172 RepID=A0A841TI37_9BACL|nr:helix-turn-helix domain-containing protein [Cohnella lubricantis]MBB6678607.1 helix-turn-helix transcriptional regulator [Cohnella lubricantis]MBP2119234.1 DNA-binding HxlR family transcriptional regulator [Cohnella lubricantis]
MEPVRNPNQLGAKIEQVHQLISRKWVSLIIHTLMSEPKRFSEIHSYIPDLSKRVLNERVKDLEQEGIVLRNVIPSRPVRTEYSLTRKGVELGRALQALEDWAEKWN